jgi:hypothetical protein
LARSRRRPSRPPPNPDTPAPSNGTTAGQTSPARVTRIVPVGTMGEAISLRVPNRSASADQVVKQIETRRSPDPIMRRPRADREEKRVTRGSDTLGQGTSMRRCLPHEPQSERTLSFHCRDTASSDFTHPAHAAAGFLCALAEVCRRTIWPRGCNDISAKRHVDWCKAETSVGHTYAFLPERRPTSPAQRELRRVFRSSRRAFRVTVAGIVQRARRAGGMIRPAIVPTRGLNLHPPGSGLGGFFVVDP